MKIAAIGMGEVGGALGKRWAEAGHEVTFGARDPASPDKQAGDLAGKVLLDCTNPLTPDFAGLVVGTTDSAGEQVARLAPRAKVVKVFNTNGAANMASPDHGTSRVTMLYAGDDAAANQVAARLAADLGRSSWGRCGPRG
jgi:predicted dinucleotide-binding enzyme